MQEEVENRTVNLAISTSRLSARTIVAGIRMYLQHQRNAAAKKPTKVEGVHGKQTVKELIGQNQGVSRMPLGDASIRDFEREARKYGVAADRGFPDGKAAERGKEAEHRKAA